jgi:transcription elongation factor GreA
MASSLPPQLEPGPNWRLSQPAFGTGLSRLCDTLAADMANNQVILSPQGKRRLEDELHLLKTDRRDELTRFMQDVRAEGDISENSGYDDARAQMGALESRIFELEDLLARATIRENIGRGEVIDIGATVVVEFDSNERVNERTFVVVTEYEANLLEGKVSDKSPLGAALKDKHPGDVVTVLAPRGEIRYKILSVVFKHEGEGEPQPAAVSALN